MSAWTALLVFGALGAAAIALPVAHEPTDSAESLLAQVRNAESAPPSAVASLRETIAADVHRIEALDEADRANLADEQATADAAHAHATSALDARLAELANKTSQLAERRAHCDGLQHDLDQAEKRADTLEQAVDEADDVLRQEQAKFNASVQAVERDLQVLGVVHSQLSEAVDSAASKANLEPQPLQHHVSGLVQAMRTELDQTRATSTLEWQLTQQRLAMDSRDTRAQHADAQNTLRQLRDSVDVCKEGVESEVEGVRQHEERVRKAREDEAAAAAAAKSVGERFDERHRARMQRVTFLTGLLDQLQSLTQNTN